MGYYYDDEDGDVERLASMAGISLEEAEKMLQESDSSEMVIQYAEHARGCKVPECADSFSRGLAMEGFWGW